MCVSGWSQFDDRDEFDTSFDQRPHEWQSQIVLVDRVDDVVSSKIGIEALRESHIDDAGIAGFWNIEIGDDRDLRLPTCALRIYRLEDKVNADSMFDEHFEACNQVGWHAG
ncbi:hypothetical protein [uncultured Enterovirga sp.]|uniref:hypothetical protein n=1 Tax=uncultured Enterovirga sp. TaxID=2026352 RepID=UPI0035CACEF4